jgi:thioredoxin reductase (NADPH)
MASAVLLVVDDDAQALAALEQALDKRYGADYQVRAEPSPAAALGLLERLASQGEPVALVIADQWMPKTTGWSFLPERGSRTPRPGGCCSSTPWTAAPNSS